MGRMLYIDADKIKTKSDIYLPTPPDLHVNGKKENNNKIKYEDITNLYR